MRSVPHLGEAICAVGHALDPVTSHEHVAKRGRLQGPRCVRPGGEMRHRLGEAQHRAIHHLNQMHWNPETSIYGFQNLKNMTSMFCKSNARRGTSSYAFHRHVAGKMYVWHVASLPTCAPERQETTHIMPCFVQASHCKHLCPLAS